MTLRRLRSATAPTTIGAVLIALGTAAAPAASIHGPRSVQPRLVVTPAKLPVAEEIAPGDRIERLAELRLRGSGHLTAVYFKARARKSSALDSDAHGLRIAIDRCSKKWRRRRTGYACPGKRFRVMSRQPLLGRTKLRRLGLRRRRPAHLRLVIDLPAAAGNSLQERKTEATYSFVGVAGKR